MGVGMSNEVTLLTAPAVTSFTFTIIEAINGALPSKAKPPVAVLLGALWASLAYLASTTVLGGSDPYAPLGLLGAIVVGVTAGAAASGIDAYRSTYGKQPDVVPAPMAPAALDVLSEVRDLLVQVADHTRDLPAALAPAPDLVVPDPAAIVPVVVPMPVPPPVVPPVALR